MSRSGYNQRAAAVGMLFWGGCMAWQTEACNRWDSWGQSCKWQNERNLVGLLQQLFAVVRGVCTGCVRER